MAKHEIVREGFEKRVVMTNPKPTSRRPIPDFDLFQKLKNFYAQPLDGCWPLRPCWVPDLNKPPKHVEKTLSSDTTGYYTDKIVTNFRRFTFDEFLQVLEMRRESKC